MKYQTSTVFLKRIIKPSSAACLIIAVCLLFSSCLKEGDDTIVIPLPDGKIPVSVIPTNMQESLTDNGFVINEGITPPNIEGMFVASPFDLLYSSDNYINSFYNLTMTMRDQKRRGMVIYTERQRDTIDGESIAAQVIGHDSCFTMYCYQYLQEYSGAELLWKCKTATVVSGVMTPVGIRNCQYAFIMLEKDAPTTYYYNQLADINTLRIFCDGDGIASKIR